MLASFNQSSPDGVFVVRRSCRLARIALWAAILAPIPASSEPVSDPAHVHRLPDGGEGRFIQARECSQRQGPFVTQNTAWQRWREARNRGYAVSNGVVPCNGGYCFFVYFRC